MNLDELIGELETIIEAVGHDGFQNALLRLDGVIHNLESYQAPRTTFRPRISEARPKAASPLRKRPALRPRVAQAATA
jgi:hypothetical protein